MKAHFAAAIALMLVLGVDASAAPTSPLWGELEPGAYAVGYKVIFASDKSRTWTARPDNVGRPVRISLWYPAVAGVQAMHMQDYLRNQALAAFAVAEADLEKRDAQVSAEWVPEAALQRFLQTSTMAYRDARQAPGSFPVILYSGGINAYTESNLVIAEYLASHGFIVATVPSLGENQSNPEQNTNAANLESAARDLEFAWSILRDRPGSAKAGFGIFGHSLGGIVSVMLAMRNTNVVAVAGLDGSYGFPDVRQMLTSSYRYAPEEMHASLLDIRRADPGTDLSLPNAFNHADRYFLSLPGMFHGDFTSFVMGAKIFGKSPPPEAQPGWTRDIGYRGYQFVARTVLHFFEAKLKQDADAAARLEADWKEPTLARGLHKPPD